MKIKFTVFISALVFLVKFSAGQGTVLHPGDMVITGFDTYTASGGTDSLYFTTLVDIEAGTVFSIANGCYEGRDPANTRSDTWVRCDNTTLNGRISSWKVTLNKAIPKGAVLGFELSSSGQITGLTVNCTAWVIDTDYLFVEDGTETGATSVQFSSTDADQIWLMQGEWTYNEVADYSLFNGRVLGGISNGADWVPVTEDLVLGSRKSRRHPQLECISLTGAITSGQRTYAAYKTSALHTGTQQQLLAEIKNTAGNWDIRPAATNAVAIDPDHQFPPGYCSNGFTVTGSLVAGKWNGSVSSDWFTCDNWENFSVPGETIDVSITSGSNEPVIDALTYPVTAAKFNNTAQSKNLVMNWPGKKLTIANSNTNKLAVSNDLTLNNGTMDFQNGNINIKGNIALNNGTYNPGSTTVILDGSTPQTIGNTIAVSPMFNNLVFDNPSGFTLVSPVIAAGAVTLVNGKITTSTSTLFTLGASGSISGGSNGSFINGPMSKLSASAGEFEFPVGKSKYRPCSIVAATANIADYQAEYFEGVPPSHTSLQAAVLGIENIEYWMIGKFAGSVNDRVKLNYINPGTGNWTPSDPCATCNIGVATFAGSQWEFTSSPGNFSSSLPEYRFYQDNGPVYSRSIGNLNPYTAGYSSNVILPVQLLQFDGKLSNNNAQLNWKIANVVDLEGFELQCSKDGQQFIRLADVTANGGFSYTYSHNQLSPGNWYYRLLIKERNGATTVSNVVILTIGNVRTSVNGLKQTVVINELGIFIFSATNQPVKASVTDILGRKLLSQIGMLQVGNNHWSIGLQSLANGMYFISIFTNDGVDQTLRFVKAK